MDHFRATRDWVDSVADELPQPTYTRSEVQILLTHRSVFQMQRMLKLGVIFSTVALFSATVYSGSPTWTDGQVTAGNARPMGIRWHKNFNRGWAAARRANRPLLIYITAPNCVYCEAMKRDTWCNKEIETEVNGDFVAIELSPEENAEVLSRIKVETYPMTLIGSPEGKIVEHRVGYQPPGAIHELLGSTRQLGSAERLAARPAGK